MNSNSTGQALKQDDLNPNKSRQPLKQEENIDSNLPRQVSQQAETIPLNPSRQPLEQENISPNMSSQSLKQESITPGSSHQNFIPSGPKEQDGLEPQGIFVYGTLMAEEFLSWVMTGSAENHTVIVSLRQPATLRSYRRVAVVHADYPALIPGNEFNQVEGFLVTPATRSQWKKLDDFEGESYRRQYVQVELTHCKNAVPAFVY